MSAIARFQSEFLSAPVGSRPQIVHQAVQQNIKNNQITNLLANVDYMATKKTTKADNIFFICQMLRSFPEFQYA